jgi:hypothetical protein
MRDWSVGDGGPTAEAGGTTVFLVGVYTEGVQPTKTAKMQNKQSEMVRTPHCIPNLSLLAYISCPYTVQARHCTLAVPSAITAGNKHAIETIFTWLVAGVRRKTGQKTLQNQCSVFVMTLLYHTQTGSSVAKSLHYCSIFPTELGLGCTEEEEENSVHNSSLH